MGKVLVNLYTRPWSGWEVMAMTWTSGHLLYWLEMTWHLILERMVRFNENTRFHIFSKGSWYLLTVSLDVIDQTFCNIKRGLGFCISDYFFIVQLSFDLVPLIYFTTDNVLCRSWGWRNFNVVFERIKKRARISRVSDHMKTAEIWKIANFWHLDFLAFWHLTFSALDLVMKLCSVYSPMNLQCCCERQMDHVGCFAWSTFLPTRPKLYSETVHGSSRSLPFNKPQPWIRLIC